MITSIYASLLALMYVYLSMRVVKHRKFHKVSIGDGGNALVARAIRVHANFAEYVPLALILIYLVEMHTAARYFVHAMGITLVLARLFHAYGISSEAADFRFRVGGVVLTFVVLILPSLFLLFANFLV
ncbi:MAG: MAPEG family protein [Bdellovibrionota bacterium]